MKLSNDIFSYLDQDIEEYVVNMEKLRQESIKIFNNLLNSKDFINSSSTEDLKATKRGQAVIELLKEYMRSMVALNIVATSRGTHQLSNILEQKGIDIWIMAYKASIEKNVDFFDLFQKFVVSYLCDIGNNKMDEMMQGMPNNMTIH